MIVIIDNIIISMIIITLITSFISLWLKEKPMAKIFYKMALTCLITGGIFSLINIILVATNKFN